MAKKKEKKAKAKKNPTILNWISDFVVAPLSNPLKNFMGLWPVDLGKWVTQKLPGQKRSYNKLYEDIWDLLDIYTKMFVHMYNLSDLEKEAKNWAEKANNDYRDVVYAVMAMEAASGGFVDIAPGYLLSVPHTRALADNAYDIYRARPRFALMPFLQRYYYAVYRPLVPEPYRLADFAAKGLISLTEYETAMAENGLTQHWASVWRRSQYKYPDIGTLLAMLRRGLIREEDFNAALIRSGIPREWTDNILGLRDVIPPLSDLIRMAVREAFPVEPGEAQFEEMKKWAKLQGLTDWWVERYWWAHFDRMALTQAYDAMVRDETGEFNIDKYLMLADIHPDDWKWVKLAAWEIPTFRELGYGWDTGLMSEEFIKKMFKWRRLHPDTIEPAYKAFIAYRLEAEREAVRRELMYKFARGDLTEEQFRKELENLQTRPEKIDLWVLRAKLYAERTAKPPPEVEPRVVTSTEALWAFKHGLKDEEWLRSKLRALNWTDERIDLAIQRALREAAVDYKVVSASEALEAFKEGLRSEEWLREKLKELLYSSERIELLVELAKKEKTEVREKALTLSQIKRLLWFGKVNYDQAKQLLVESGYSEEKAGLILELWEAEFTVEPEPRRLTKADIAGMYDMGVITGDEVKSLLRKIGYSSEDAEKLALDIKVSVRFPDLRAMYRNGWVTSAEVYEELKRLGLPEERANELLMTIVKAEQPERVRKERDLTKSEIVKGVKNGIITPEQGVGLLQELGYEEWEAWYILMVNKVVEAGDPQGYWEMRKVVELYKKARGEKALEVPDEVLELERQIQEQKRKIEQLKKEGKPEGVIAVEVSKLNDLEYKLRQLLVTAGLSK